MNNHHYMNQNYTIYGNTQQQQQQQLLGQEYFQPSSFIVNNQKPAVYNRPTTQYNNNNSEQQKVYSFVPLDVVTQKKRPRKKYNEVERLYQCTYQNCTKAYGTLNHLNAHVSMQRHGPKRLPAEFKELRRQLKANRAKNQTPKIQNPLMEQQHTTIYPYQLQSLHPPPPPPPPPPPSFVSYHPNTLLPPLPSNSFNSQQRQHYPFH